MARSHHVSSDIELTEIAVPVSDNTYKPDPSGNLQTQENSGNPKSQGAHVIMDGELIFLGCINNFCRHMLEPSLK